MFCSQCGAKIPDNAKFCYKCGAKVEIPEWDEEYWGKKSAEETVPAAPEENEIEWPDEKALEEQPEEVELPFSWPEFVYDADEQESEQTEEKPQEIPEIPEEAPAEALETAAEEPQREIPVQTDTPEEEILQPEQPSEEPEEQEVLPDAVPEQPELPEEVAEEIPAREEAPEEEHVPEEEAHEEAPSAEETSADEPLTEPEHAEEPATAVSELPEPETEEVPLTGETAVPDEPAIQEETYMTPAASDEQQPEETADILQESDFSEIFEPIDESLFFPQGDTLRDDVAQFEIKENYAENPAEKIAKPEETEILPEIPQPDPEVSFSAEESVTEPEEVRPIEEEPAEPEETEKIPETSEPTPEVSFTGEEPAAEPEEVRPAEEEPAEPEVPRETAAEDETAEQTLPDVMAGPEEEEQPEVEEFMFYHGSDETEQSEQGPAQEPEEIEFLPQTGMVDDFTGPQEEISFSGEQETEIETGEISFRQPEEENAALEDISFIGETDGMAVAAAEIPDEKPEEPAGLAASEEEKSETPDGRQIFKADATGETEPAVMEERQVFKAQGSAAEAADSDRGPDGSASEESPEVEERILSPKEKRRAERQRRREEEAERAARRRKDSAAGIHGDDEEEDDRVHNIQDPVADRQRRIRRTILTAVAVLLLLAGLSYGGYLYYNLPDRVYSRHMSAAARAEEQGDIYTAAIEYHEALKIRPDSMMASDKIAQFWDETTANIDECVRKSMYSEAQQQAQLLKTIDRDRYSEAADKLLELYLQWVSASAMTGSDQDIQRVLDLASADLTRDAFSKVQDMAKASQTRYKYAAFFMEHGEELLDLNDKGDTVAVFAALEEMLPDIRDYVAGAGLFPVRTGADSQGREAGFYASEDLLQLYIGNYDDSGYRTGEAVSYAIILGDDHQYEYHVSNWQDDVPQGTFSSRDFGSDYRGAATASSRGTLAGGFYDGVISITDPGGVTYRVTFDSGHAQVIAATSPDGHRNVVGYNGDGTRWLWFDDEQLAHTYGVVYGQRNFG